MDKKIILCVDDESIILDALQEQLDNCFGEEYKVETSDSAEDALEFFKELQEDGIQVPVIISDYIMPGMKGDELLKEIHSLSPGSLKILLTGQASLEGISNAINNAQLYRFIAKPWDKEDLVLTVKEAIKSFLQELKIRKKNAELEKLNASLEEQVIERTKELQQANAEKDKFFSIIAHDLKSPFNALLGLSDLMIENWEVLEDHEKMEFTKDIHNSSKDTFNLLKNLLDWTRSQTGRVKVEPSNFSPAQVIDENMKVLKPHANSKGISIINNVTESMICYADKNMISTVLRNLISNAIKFTKADGKIVISSEQVDGFYKICVSDNGIGMNQQTQDELFQLSNKTQRNGTSEETGTGLGLLLCKEFTENNKGTISVSSKENEGSTFCITIPVSA